jgi:uncharacterized protein (TIGR02444 family)
VAPLCLELQSEGADVCLLLCGLWLERRGVLCSTPRMAQLRNLAEPWQTQVIEPLRQLRQGWKQAAVGDAQWLQLREQLKALELQAERELLERLEVLAGQWPHGETEASDWLYPLSGLQELRGRDALDRLRGAAR